MKDRYRTSGIIGVTLGPLFLIGNLGPESGVRDGSDAYVIGQLIGRVVVPWLFLLGGIYYLRKARNTEE